MKYLKQLGLILLFAFIGELLHALIPLNIPASVYGIVLLFVLLMTGVVKVDMIRETGALLVELMPIMFVPAAVGLMQNWGLLKANLLPYAVMIIVTTVIVMAVSGRVTQAIIRRKEDGKHE